MRTLPVAIALAIAACGGGGKPATPRTPSNHAHDHAGGGAAAGGPDRICERIAALSEAGCAPFTSYSLDRAGCVEDMRRSLEDRGPDAREATLDYGACLEADACNAVLDCIAQLDAPEGGLRACNDHSSGAAVGVPRVAYDKRRGAGSHRFSDVPTTKSAPIEVCEIRAEMDWLMRMVCDDGSRPFASDDHAHAARVGNVGAGGACGSIIDLYEVPCPEATYQIYMDAYVCPL